MAIRAAATPITEFVQRSRLFRTRGVSLDTSLMTNYSVEQALTAMKARGLLKPGAMRRVAIVGPGFDLGLATPARVARQQRPQPFRRFAVRSGFTAPPPALRARTALRTVLVAVVFAAGFAALPVFALRVVFLTVLVLALTVLVLADLDCFAFASAAVSVPVFLVIGAAGFASPLDGFASVLSMSSDVSALRSAFSSDPNLGIALFFTGCHVCWGPIERCRAISLAASSCVKRPR